MPPKKIQIKLLEEMLKIRLTEEMIAKKYYEQKMRCPIHLSIGQEASATGVCFGLKNSDKVFSAHRSHAHYISKGGSIKSLFSELHGKVSGCAKGLGGSMHLLDLKKGFSGAVPIVGSSIPIATGTAWANKLNKLNDLVVIFLGDGATEEGVFFESLDFASLMKLKILFVCENNFFSVYSPIYKRQSKKRNLLKIANSLGIKSTFIDGNDIENVHLKTEKIKKYIKKNSEPFFLLLNTFRYIEHCGPNNDDHLNYRSKNMIKLWEKKCPIVNYKKKLINRKILDHRKFSELEKKISNSLIKSFKYAEKQNFPTKKILNNFIDI